MRRPAWAAPLSDDRARPGLTILTGGQTGVDTIAAIAALRAGLGVHVVFPRGFLQEDGPLTTERRRELDGADLHELPGAEFRDRTWSCVQLSDAVVLIDPAGGEGCRETAVAARELGRPLLELTATTGGGSGSAAGGRGPATEAAAAGGRGPATEAAAAGGRGPAPAEALTAWLVRTGARLLMVAGCRGSLLAAAGCRELAASQIAEVIFVARQRNDQLTA